MMYVCALGSTTVYDTANAFYIALYGKKIFSHLKFFDQILQFPRLVEPFNGCSILWGRKNIGRMRTVPKEHKGCYTVNFLSLFPSPAAGVVTNQTHPGREL